jgi:putative spermidine/putrescine transport system ATP-binding protein
MSLIRQVELRSDHPTVAADSGAPDLVCFEGVRKSYDGIHFVVENLDLRVRRGEFLTMLGPSGSGKTTTLMMLGGFERPTLGRILLGGRPVERLPPEKRNIGFVFQNYALFPHMTVAENIAFPLRYRGITGAAAAQKVSLALDMVRLGNFGDRRPAQLSGGQQQRVALARALVFEPSLVLMDEPLGALDKQLRERMQIEIKHLQTSLGITMVYVTHDQSEALTMSDRVTVFHEGRIQQIADPRTLYDRPENRFVAEFVGENNVIACTLVSVEGERATVRTEGGTILQGMLPKALDREQDMILSIRPERLALTERAIPSSHNAIRGQVEEMFFLGDHVRLSVSMMGGERVVARIPASETRAFLPGESITLACHVDDCRLLGS